jgi:hypothetical protein
MAIAAQATTIVRKTNGSTNGQTNGMTPEQELAMLRAENAKLKATAQAQAQALLRCKVGEKGGVMVMGLGRFPTTLYRSQWERLIAFIKTGEIERFIEANAAHLSVKGD